MDAQRLFLDQLPLIERVVHFICRRYALKGADAEDFASTVKLQLIDHDYAILRQFQQRSSLGTYLKVVIQRMYLDQRVREWGKWRPAVRARQLGEPAILLDLLVNRDGQPVADALRAVHQRFPDLDPTELRTIEQSLHIRTRHRPIEEPINELPDGAACAESGEDALLEHERQENARHANEVLAQTMSRFSAEDRVILRLRFGDSLKISTIAAMLQIDQKPLYRRIDKLLHQLRMALAKDGLGADAIGELIAHDTDLLDIPFGGPPESPASPSAPEMTA